MRLLLHNRPVVSAEGARLPLVGIGVLFWPIHLFAGGVCMKVFVPGKCTVMAADGVGAGAEAVAAASMRCCCPSGWKLSLLYGRPWLWRPLLERPLLLR